MTLLGFLIWALCSIIVGILHAVLHVLLKPLAAWGMELAFSFAQQAWLALILTGLAIMVMQSLRPWEFLVLALDALACLGIPIYGWYADHLHLDSLFWHMKKELWKQEMLSASEILSSEGYLGLTKMSVELGWASIVERVSHAENNPVYRRYCARCSCCKKGGDRLPSNNNNKDAEKKIVNLTCSENVGRR